MKLASTFCLALIGTVIISCNLHKDPRKSFDNAVAYNDYLIDRLDVLNKLYTHALDTNMSLVDALQACDSLVMLCERTTEEMKGIQPFEGDSSLTMQSLEYTQYMKLNAEKHMKKFLELQEQYLQSTDLTEEEDAALYGQIEKALAEINLKQEKELAKLDAVQQKFADKHNLQVMDSESE